MGSEMCIRDSFTCAFKKIKAIVFFAYKPQNVGWQNHGEPRILTSCNCLRHPYIMPDKPSVRKMPLPRKNPPRWKRLKSRQGAMQIRKELNLTYNLNRNTAPSRTPCLFFGVLSCWLNLITLQNNQTRCSTINLDAFFRSWACGRSGFEMIGGTPKTTRRLDDKQLS